MPKPEASISRPSALAKSALPSASISTLLSTFWFLPQLSMTKASLTETQAMASMPFFLNSSACCRKPGRCLAEQVGVKAPGTANSTTFLPLNSSSVVISAMPSLPRYLNFADGTLSPTLMVIVIPL